MHIGAAPTKVKICTYVLLIAIALGCFFLWLHASSLSVAEPTLAKSFDVQAKIIDLYTDSIKSLSSYSLLVLAGVGFFIQMIFSPDANIKASVTAKCLLVVAVFTCAVSLLFGYLGYRNVIDMLYNRLVLNPSDSRIYAFHEIQFWAFMASVVLFTIFSCETLFRKG
jgi:hypothetical protein